MCLSKWARKPGPAWIIAQVDGTMETRASVNTGSILYLPSFYVSVKTTSIYFAIKAVHDENSEACQTHRDAKWSGEHWQ